jgi:hypothetical protein
MLRTEQQRKHFLWFVLLVVGVNYLAQIPYYLDAYYFAHGTLPNLRGSLLLGLTLLWFGAGYALLARGRTAGYWLLVSFLVAEVGFYAFNVANRVANGVPALIDLQTHDPLLWTVFLIGYINMLAGFYFLVYLALNRRELLSLATSAAVGA